MYRVLGVVLVVVALAIGIVPQFTDCFSQGKTVALANGSTQPMKCHWSAQAEIAVAVPLVGVGAMLSFSKRKKTILSLSAVGVVLGVMAIALPATLIGTCGNATMFCNTAMKPSLYSLGSIAVAGSLGMMVLARKAQD